MYYSDWRHLNRHYRHMQPTQPMQPAQPLGGGMPTISTLTQYLQQLLPQVMQQYAPPGTIQAVQPVTVQSLSNSRNTLIGFYEQNLASWRKLLNTPAVTSTTTDVHAALAERERLNNHYMQLDNYYKTMIRQVEGQINQLGGAAFPYPFSS